MNEQSLIKRFGKDNYEFATLPNKYSNVKISRIFNGDLMGCSYCFPHGHETSNSKYINYPNRNWKKYRKTQYKN